MLSLNMYSNELWLLVVQKENSAREKFKQKAELFTTEIMTENLYDIQLAPELNSIALNGLTAIALVQSNECFWIAYILCAQLPA